MEPLPLRAFPRLGSGLRQGGDTEPGAPVPITICHRAYHHTGGAAGGGVGGPCHVAGAERQSGEGCGVPEVRGCRHFPGYPLCSEPVTRGNTLRTGQRRGVPGGAAAAGATASHALPAVGSCRPPGPPPSPRVGPKAGTGTEAPNKGARGRCGARAARPRCTGPICHIPRATVSPGATLQPWGTGGVGMGGHGRAHPTRSHPEAPASAGSEHPSVPIQHQHPLPFRSLS